MPIGEGNEVELVFFNDRVPGEKYSDDDLEKEFESRGLKSADPFSVIAANEVDRELALKHPHASHWKDADGNWCSIKLDAAFNSQGKSEVIIGRNSSSDLYGGGWKFVGIKK